MESPNYSQFNDETYLFFIFVRLFKDVRTRTFLLQLRNRQESRLSDWDYLFPGTAIFLSLFIALSQTDKNQATERTCSK